MRAEPLFTVRQHTKRGGCSIVREQTGNAREGVIPGSHPLATALVVDAPVPLAWVLVEVVPARIASVIEASAVVSPSAAAVHGIFCSRLRMR